MTKPATPRLRVRRRTPRTRASSGRRNLLLAVVVLLVGAGTSVFGFRFGQNALQEVNTPRSVVADNRKPLGKSQGLLRESDILASIASLPEVGDAPEVTAEELLEQQEDAAAEDPSLAKLKVDARTSDQEVTLTVDTVAWQGQNLTLQVSLQNRSYKPVRFVFSPAFDLLALSDDQGHTLRTFTDGLPGELPDDQEVYKGAIQVPMSELEGAQELNLTLTDYPDREIQLNLRGIPIPKRP